MKSSIHNKSPFRFHLFFLYSVIVKSDFISKMLNSVGFILFFSFFYVLDGTLAAAESGPMISYSNFELEEGNSYVYKHWNNENVSILSTNEYDVLAPAMAFEMTANPVVVEKAGQSIKYTYIVNNIGDDRLTGVVVKDSDFGVIELNAQTIEPEGSVTGNASSVVNQGNIDAGLDIVNTATARAAQVSEIEKSVTVSVIQLTDVTVSVSASPQEFEVAGETINFTVLVENSGNVTLNDIVVTDNLTGLDRNISSLAPKNSEPISTIYTIDDDDVEEESITYIVTASVGDSIDVSENATVKLFKNPELTVSVTAPENFSELNQKIEYKILVENTGNVELTDVIVSDPLLSNEETIGNLAAGSSYSTGGAYSITQSDLNNGTLSISAYATGNDPDGNLIEGSDVLILTGTQSTGINITKTASPQDYSELDETITYTIVVENTGNVDLYDVTLTDEKLDLTKTIGTLAGGTSNTTQETYSITQADLNNGTLSNTASVTGNDPDGNPLNDSVEESITGTQSTGINITKTASPQDYSELGETITYTIVVENTGNVDLYDVTLTDEKLDLTKTIGTLAGGTSNTTQETYSITQADLNNGTLSNTASVTGNDPDGNPLNDSVEESITGTQSTGINITKTASPQDYSELGETITYTIVVENTGNVDLYDVTLTDEKLNLTKTIGTLAGGTSNTTQENYSVTQADLNNGTLSNTASVTGNDPDGNPLNDSVEETINATQSAGISITKSASPLTFSSVGNTINYTLLVQNTGNVNLTNVVVTDQMLNIEETIGTLSAGATKSFSETYTITQIDLNNGTLSNTAFVSGNEPNGGTVSDDDQVTVTANQNPVISVNKTASPLTYDTVGDEITYTITVSNGGNVMLTDIAVDDPLTGMDEYIAVLTPGESESYTETITITQSHLNTGSLTNTVSVSGNGPNIVVTDTDNATVTALGEPELSVTKTASPETYKAVGDEIGYTIVVENTGNVTLSNVMVQDPLTQLNESIGRLNPGQVQNLSATYTITNTDLEEGIVISTVTVSGTHGGETIDADAEAVVAALYPPVANDDVSADHISGNAVVVDVLENDLLNDGSPALPGLVTVDLNQQAGGIQHRVDIPGEGVWSYNPQSGALTFTPQSGFTTDPTPISYLLTENSTGLNDDATVTVDYNEGEPFAFNDISTNNIPGEPVTINIISNDKLSDGSPATVQQVTIDIDVTQAGVQTEKSVPEEGSWVYNPETGEITFTPLPGYSTNPTPLEYSLTENLTELSDNGTVTIGYDEQPPVAADDNSTGNAPGFEVTMNILENDELGDGTPALPGLVTVDINPDRAGIQDELEISGEGIWSFDVSTGDVTFTPQAGFTGTPEPLIYRLTEVLTGLYDDAAVTIIYNEEAPIAVDDFSDDNEPGSEISINILENDLLSDGTPALPEAVTIDLDPDVEGVQHEILVQGQGTWMYNSENGVLIFSPQSGFFDDPSPLFYELCSIWNPEVCSQAEVVAGYRQEASMASVGLIKEGTYFSEDEVINYTFNVINTGTLPVWDITITDEQLGITSLQIVPDTLLPGETGTANATYQVTQSDKNNGDVTNSAIASGFIFNGERIEDISGSTVDNDEPTVTPLLQIPSIRIEKQAILFSSEAVLNEVVEFMITVTNNGNVVLDDVEIEDPLTGFEQLVGQLLPGSTVDYTTGYTVQPEDEMSGEFINTAIAKAVAPDGSELSDSSTVIVTVEQCEMVVPTGFSPNDDGIQDVWRIKCLEKYPDARVEIFNRWGNRVFEKKNFGNTDVHGVAGAWWDGYSTSKRTFGSGKLPAGTYYYILYLQNGQEPLNGYIFLNR